jgi:hypothetical protein
MPIVLAAALLSLRHFFQQELSQSSLELDQGDQDDQEK